jgi:hypothetical protein
MVQGPNLLRRFGRGALHFVLVTLVMMLVGRAAEAAIDKASFMSLAGAQTQALAAVQAINPLMITDRYICALTPSVAEMNRKYKQDHPNAGTFFLGNRPLIFDCAYSLPQRAARTAATSSTPVRVDDAVLPPPVVGHWADGLNPLVMPVAAFLDTGWHLIVQPSLFGSVFALFSFIVGGVLAGAAMAMSRWDYPGYFGPLVWCIGSIACACLVAFCLKELMEGALYLFGQFTQIAGLCCGSAGVTYFGYTFTVKAVEGQVHGAVEHVIPH